jgi:hypothetical protein
MTTRVPFFLVCTAACATIVLAGCGTQHAGSPAHVTAARSVAAPTAGSPRQRAAADAARIMASFPPPRGAVRSGRTTSPLLTAPSEGPAASPDVVTATQWWTAPGQPTAVLAWVRAHVPAGFSLGGWGSGGYNQPGGVAPAPEPSVQHPDTWFDQYSLPVVAGVLTQRWLLVTVADRGHGRTAIRVDAQVVWLPPRPAAGRIPSDARVVTVTPVFGLQPDKKRKHLDPAFTVTNPATVARIAAVVDGLTILPPGVYPCPADFGATMRLTFRTRPGGPVVARVTAEYGGCGVVSVSIGGRSMPALSEYTGSGQQLQQRVLAIAGVRWPYPPGMPPGWGG